MSDLTSIQGLTTDQLGTLIERAGGCEQVRRILSGEFEVQLVATEGVIVQPPPAERFVTIPAGVEFETRVARGRYGWRHSDLTEAQFPVTADQCGDLHFRRFHFARSISSVEAIQSIREAGFEPAKIGHVLAFGEESPGEQRRYPVIGLGSQAEVDQKVSVPALWFDGERRTLDLIWFEGDWHRNYRFLGVRRRAPRENRKS